MDRISHFNQWLPQSWQPERIDSRAVAHIGAEVLRSPVERALNHSISDRLPIYVMTSATLRTTHDGKLALSLGSEEIHFQDEKSMNVWLADKSVADILEIEDLREEVPGCFYKLTRGGKFATKEEFSIN